MKVFSRNKEGRTAILEGGLNRIRTARGPMLDTHWSGHVSIDAFDILVNTHKAYIDAGADVITVNSHASSRLVLGDSMNVSLIEKNKNTKQLSKQE